MFTVVRTGDKRGVPQVKVRRQRLLGYRWVQLDPGQTGN
jgi:hypothetical protein